MMIALYFVRILLISLGVADFQVVRCYTTSSRLICCLLKPPSRDNRLIQGRNEDGSLTITMRSRSQSL